MAFTKNKIGVVLLVSLLGALIGVILGKLIGALIPATNNFLNNIGTGNKLILDLDVITFGIKFNVAAVLGVITALLLFRKL